MHDMHLTSFGNLIFFLALVGASTMMAVILRLADTLLTRVMEVLKSRFRRHRNLWKRSRMRKTLRPMTTAEREAMEQGLREALDSFHRAELAAHGRA